MDFYSLLLAKQLGGGGGGGSATLIDKNISANGTYNASTDNADGYKKVVVNVPNPSTGSLSISANGTYDVTNYASADVNVSGGSAELVPVLDGTITSLSNNEVTSLRANAFNLCGNLLSVSLPNCTAINSNSLANCAKLETVNLPKLATIMGTYDFSSDKKLVSVTLPALNGALGNWTFNDCSLLETVDLGENANNLSSQSFLKCSVLNKLILRCSSVVTTNTNVFNNTPFANGGAGGTVYVPSALVETYKTATNWSTLFGYGTITFSSIEGSIYATQYADGTPIGA